MPGKPLNGISILDSNILCLPSTSKWLYTKLTSSNMSKIVKDHPRFILHYSASQINIKQRTPRMVSCHVTCFQLKDRKQPLRDFLSTVQKTHRSPVTCFMFPYLAQGLSRSVLMIPLILQPFIVTMALFNWWYIHVASEPHSSFFHYLVMAFLSARRSLYGDTTILKQFYEWIHINEEIHSKPRDYSYSQSALCNNACDFTSL